MRVMVNALEPSHLMPMVPLLWALQARGNEVLVFGFEDTAHAAETAGLSAWRCQSEEGSVSRWRPPRSTAPKPAQAPPPASRDRTALIAERWRARIELFIDEYLAVARSWRPDLIITDPLEFSGLVIAGALDIPCVIHRWGFDNFSSGVQEAARSALKQTCVWLGAEGGPATPRTGGGPLPSQRAVARGTTTDPDQVRAVQRGWSHA